MRHRCSTEYRGDPLKVGGRPIKDGTPPLPLGSAAREPSVLHCTLTNSRSFSWRSLANPVLNKRKCLEGVGTYAHKFRTVQC